MTRRQWMWLWIWLLLFFIIFCVWDKLQKFTADQKDSDTITTTSVPAVAAATAGAVATVDAVQKHARAVSDTVESNKDINFKIINATYNYKFNK